MKTREKDYSCSVYSSSAFKLLCIHIKDGHMTFNLRFMEINKIKKPTKTDSCLMQRKCVQTAHKHPLHVKGH